MNQKTPKIYILNESDFDEFIQKYDFEKFSCSASKHNEADVLLRIAIVTDSEKFNEIIELLEYLNLDFSVFGGRIKRKHYCVIELIKDI